MSGIANWLPNWWMSALALPLWLRLLAFFIAVILADIAVDKMRWQVAGDVYVVCFLILLASPWFFYWAGFIPWYVAMIANGIAGVTYFSVIVDFA